MPRVVPSQVVTLIHRLFPFTAMQKDTQQNLVYLELTHANQLAAIVELTDQIPPELINLEGDDYTVYASSLTAIRTAIATWQARGGVHPLTCVPGFGNLNPVTLLRRSLELCPDESPAPSTVGLAFIPDQEFRENLRTDISAANQALSNGEWKAATVLAGSTVEALLLWILKQRPKVDIQDAVNALLKNGSLRKNPGKIIDEWSLHPFIQVAEKLNIIKPETATQSRLAQGFRNLIHPGQAIRIGQTCDRGTALSAVAAVEHVIRDLTRFFGVP